MQIDMGINSTYSPSLNLSLHPTYSQPLTDESAYVAPGYAGRLSVSTVDDGVNACCCYNWRPTPPWIPDAQRPFRTSFSSKDRKRIAAREPLGLIYNVTGSYLLREPAKVQPHYQSFGLAIRTLSLKLVPAGLPPRISANLVDLAS